MNIRQIKFRGKKVENGEWVYGSLVNNVFFYGEHHSFYPNPVCQIITGKYEGDCWQDIAEDEENAIVTVMPESVGQYTGLKDKNNKEIFEGDILISESGKNIAVVEQGWFTGKLKFLPVHLESFEMLGWVVRNNIGHVEPLDNSFINGEIIGNIYEHKHLLEEKTKTA